MKNLTLLHTLKKYGNYQRKKGSSEIMIARYYQEIRKIFNGCGKVENWRKIKASQIENFIFSQKRTDRTKQTQSYQMRSFFKFCKMKRYKTIDPCEILAPKPKPTEARRLMEEEIAEIFKYVENKPKEKALIHLFLSSGMRLAEVASLSWEQIKRATQIGNMYQVNIIGKGSKLRSVFPTVEAVNLCNAFKKASPDKVIGRPAQRIGRRIRQISKALKIRFTPHTLRHTYLSHLVKKGADISRVQKIAGHSSILTTQIYLHCFNKELIETAKLICDLV